MSKFSPYNYVDTKMIFARCVKIVFFRRFFEVIFPYNFVVEEYALFFLTHRAELCQKCFGDLGPYIYG